MEQTSMFTGMAEDKFNKFHKKNPQVYAEIVKLAFDAKKAGRTRIGMNMLIEVVRWNTMLKTEGDVYKINNNFAPRYVRLLIQDYPMFESMFNLRAIRTL